MVSVSRYLLTFVATRSHGRSLPYAQKFRAMGPSAAFCTMDGRMVGENNAPRHQFEVLGRNMVYSGWRKIVKKTVRIENEKDYVFDVVHQEDPSVAVFVWHTDSKTLTLVKEFSPGREEVQHGVVAGLYERKKHESPLQAAKFELDEEAHLQGGKWYPLGDNADASICADKYSTNEFFCWLVVDPEITLTPRELDDEEFIEIVRDISMQRAMSMLTCGELSVVSGFIVLLAARKLRQLGLLTQEY